MILYLIRHAIAQDPTGNMTDAERPLTPEGIKKFRAAARGFLRITDPKHISHLLTSPLLRAQQTAQILAQALHKHHPKITPRLCPALAQPHLSPLLKELRSLKHPTGILLIGHEPTLSQWITQLCFSQSSAGRITFKKGAIAALEFSPKSPATRPTAQLLFLLPPAILRKL